MPRKFFDYAPSNIGPEMQLQALQDQARLQPSLGDRLLAQAGQGLKDYLLYKHGERALQQKKQEEQNQRDFESGQHRQAIEAQLAPHGLGYDDNGQIIKKPELARTNNGEQKQYAHRIIETNGELYSYDPASDQTIPLGLKTKEKGQGKSRFKPTYNYQTGTITGSYDTWTGKLQDMTGKTVVPQATPVTPGTPAKVYPERPVLEWTDKELQQGYQDH